MTKAHRLRPVLRAPKVRQAIEGVAAVHAVPRPVNSTGSQRHDPDGDQERQVRAGEAPYQISPAKFADDEQNRGDSTPVELFVEGIRAWEPGIRVLLAVKP